MRRAVVLLAALSGACRGLNFLSKSYGKGYGAFQSDADDKKLCIDEARQCRLKNADACRNDDYVGTKSVTQNGRECQPWAASSPHQHHRPKTIPYNYCRNPDNEANGPWCYTMDPLVRWEACFPYCDEYCTDEARQCKRSDVKKCSRGHYQSTKSTTVSGRTCQAWAADAPNKIMERYKKEKANYCRNPDSNRFGPWCYTTDPEFSWDYCFMQCDTCVDKVNLCFTGDEESCTREPYAGNRTTTMSGLECQPWAAQYPHKHEYLDSADVDKNFCRNPDKGQGGPWCYTTNPQYRWEHCFKPCGGGEHSPPFPQRETSYRLLLLR